MHDSQRVCPGGNNERTIALIPVQPCDSSGTITAQFLLTASPSRAPGPVTSDPQVGTARPRRTGSLALFFRKVRIVFISYSGACPCVGPSSQPCSPSAGVPPGQRAAQGPVREDGRLLRAAGEDLDLF